MPVGMMRVQAMDNLGVGCGWRVGVGGWGVGGWGGGGWGGRGVGGGGWGGGVLAAWFRRGGSGCSQATSAPRRPPHTPHFRVSCARTHAHLPTPSPPPPVRLHPQLLHLRQVLPPAVVVVVGDVARRVALRVAALLGLWGAAAAGQTGMTGCAEPRSRRRRAPWSGCPAACPAASEASASLPPPARPPPSLTNTSQMLGPLPSSFQAPSIWYALVAPPQMMLLMRSALGGGGWVGGG
jgi:hypothetical protein